MCARPRAGPDLEQLLGQQGGKDQPGKPRSPGLLSSSPQALLRAPGRCLKHSWEQMLGPEVKHSRLMIDDADLQPEVVRFGERPGEPHGSPLSLLITMW